MKKLILVRHGESQWNKENRFTGWIDIDLSDKGIMEAKRAGEILKNNNILVDYAFCSYLKRSIKTLNYCLESADQLYVPVTKSYLLNERHYGALQGLNKDELRKEYGEEQVHIWRRSYDVIPPLTPIKEEIYTHKYKSYQEPRGESLKLTLERVLPFYKSDIVPKLIDNDVVLVVAHGNSIRSLIKHIENISDEDILKIEIATAVLNVYELDDDLKVIKKYILN